MQPPPPQGPPPPGPPPPPPPGMGPVPGGPPQQPQNGLGLTGMILGIASIPLCFCYLGIPLGVTAVILSFLGKKKAEEGLATNRGMALAGLITGIVGIAFGIIQIVLIVIGVASGGLGQFDV